MGNRYRQFRGRRDGRKLILNPFVILIISITIFRMHLSRIMGWKRTSFQVTGAQKLWRPQHMRGRQLKKVEDKLFQAQVVIDVMDSRAPMTTRNKTLMTKTPAPRIALFNKIDLTNLTDKQKSILESNERKLGAESVLFGFWLIILIDCSLFAKLGECFTAVSNMNKSNDIQLTSYDKLSFRMFLSPNYSSALHIKSALIQRTLIDEIKKLSGPVRSEKGTIDCIITGLPNVGKVSSDFLRCLNLEREGK